MKQNFLTSGNKYPSDVCEKFPQLYTQPSCQDQLNAGMMEMMFEAAMDWNVTKTAW